MKELPNLMFTLHFYNKPLALRYIIIDYCTELNHLFLRSEYRTRKKGTCVKKLSRTRCQGVAVSISDSFDDETNDKWPSGCYRGSRVWYNNDQNKAPCTGGVKECFCRILESKSS